MVENKQFDQTSIGVGYRIEGAILSDIKGREFLLK